MKAILTIGALCLLPVGSAAEPATPASVPPPAENFQELRIHIEVDLPSAGLLVDPATSLSQLAAEFSFEARSKQSLRELRIVDPTGVESMRLVHDLVEGVTTSVVALEFVGAPLHEVLALHPPGVYYVEGVTKAGALVTGSVELSHEFPGRFSVQSPEQNKPVDADSVVFAWTRSVGAKRYLLEVEDPGMDFRFEVALPASQTRFAMPPALLAAGREYEYSLSVEGDTDNQLENEGAFTTLPVRQAR